MRPDAGAAGSILRQSGRALYGMTQASTHRPGTQGSAPSAAQVNFAERADPALLQELMDEPCSYELLRGCLHDLASVNRWTLAYRPTLQFLARAVSARDTGQRPLRVLDVGSGGGDTLRRLVRWARRRKLPLDLLGIDLNPQATRAAVEFSAEQRRYGAIRWMTGDVLTEPAAQGSDLVISSLLTHHLRDAEIVDLLRWMERTAQQGWFINDLLRSPKAYRFFRLLARVMRWHPFVQYDGPVSIRRGFRPADWERLLAAAGIPSGAVTLTQPVPGRLCLTRLR